MMPITAAGRETPALTKGPIRAVVLRVADGDSVEVRAHLWPGLEMRTLVRLRGVDAPELRGRCPLERRLAQQARTHLEQRLEAGVVELHDIRHDKYGGRVTARLFVDAADVGAELVAHGLARPYGGKGPRQSWYTNTPPPDGDVRSDTLFSSP